jgi:hypothetical protein
MPMLTCNQALRLATRKIEPPWRFGDVPPIFGRSPGQAMSVKVFSNLVGNTQALLFVSVRELSILIESNTVEELVANWQNSPGLSKRALEQFAAMLGANGGTIKYLSPDRRVLAISGGTANLGQIPALRIMDINWDAAKAEAQGAAWIGAAIITIGGRIPGEAGWYVMGLGLALVGAGALTYAEAGLIQDLASPTVTTIPEVTVVGEPTIPEVTVVGEPPAGVDAGNVVNADPVNISNMPDQPPSDEPPPDEPPIC